MIRVAAGILTRGDRVLVCRRAHGSDHAGKWELPGGKIEKGETAREALRRELREELDIDAEIGAAVWTTRHRYGSAEPVEITFFAVAAFRGEPKNLVFDTLEWAARGTLSERDFLEADHELVAELDRRTDLARTRTTRPV